MKKQDIMAMFKRQNVEIDTAVRNDFMRDMSNRLAKQRENGRLGWYLCDQDELACLLGNVLAKAGDNMYVDLANIAMFCAALEIPPEGVRETVHMLLNDRAMDAKFEAQEPLAGCPVGAGCDDQGCPEHYADKEVEVEEEVEEIPIPPANSSPLTGVNYVLYRNNQRLDSTYRYSKSTNMFYPVTAVGKPISGAVGDIALDGSLTWEEV